MTVPILAVLGLFFLYNKNKPPCPNCNVILVSLDTLSALHLPCYGYSLNTAPNLCHFAEENVFFLNSYSQSPNTLNSHFSLFTSLYPHTHHMTEIYGAPLNKNIPTLAEMFKNNGYQTSYNGPINDPYLPLDRGIARGFNTIYENTQPEDWQQSFDELKKNTESGKPSFLFLHTYAVHDSFLLEDSSSPFTHQYSKDFLNFVITDYQENGFWHENFKSLHNDIDIDQVYQIMTQLIQTTDQLKAKKIFFSLPQKVIDLFYAYWDFKNFDKNNQQQVTYYRNLYDKQIEILDKKLNLLFDLLNDPQFSSNTILIITSDHGEEFMEHGQILHGHNLYRTSTQVPLIIHVPNVKPISIDYLVQSVDIYPTLLHLTGISPQTSFEGTDLSGLINGNKTTKSNTILSEWRGQIAKQKGDWRLYENQDVYELYNLKNDPQETNNLSSQYPEIIKQLR